MEDRGGRGQNVLPEKKSKMFALSGISYYIVQSPRFLSLRDEAMGKVTKIFLAVCLAAAFAFAQAVDTTVTQDSTVQTVATATPAPASTSVKKATTGNLPGKAPTNWSKIKDLFL